MIFTWIWLAALTWSLAFCFCISIFSASARLITKSQQPYLSNRQIHLAHSNPELHVVRCTINVCWCVHIHTQMADLGCKVYCGAQRCVDVYYTCWCVVACTGVNWNAPRCTHVYWRALLYWSLLMYWCIDAHWNVFNHLRRQPDIFKGQADPVDPFKGQTDLF